MSLKKSRIISKWYLLTVLTGMCDDITDQSGDGDGLKKDF